MYTENQVRVHVFLAVDKKLNVTGRLYLVVTIVVCVHNTIIINFL